MSKITKIAVALTASLSMSSFCNAGTLIINSNASDPAPKAAFEEIVTKFEAENPDIKVKYNLYDHEAYKTTIRNWLATSPPDVVFWYPGNRMKAFVDRKLFSDVSDIWSNNNMSDDFASSIQTLTVDGKQWGVPYTFYQWGFYYRKDLFEKVGVSEPKTWEDFLKVCKKLKAAGITPITIGTKNLWPSAGWFDYINLRTNGFQFHMDLMDGKIPYTDERVRDTFAKFGEVVNADYFIKDHAAYSWQEAQAFLYNGQAAMYLIGNFITPNFPDELEGKFSFFQFPIIDPAVGIVEEAPIDSLHIPAKAKNKEDARTFLAYMARPESQTKINKALLQIPTNKRATTADNYFLTKGAKMLASADATTQFFDRDTDPAMAKAGMQGFQEFMVYPDRLENILKKLERARKRVYQN